MPATSRWQLRRGQISRHASRMVYVLMPMEPLCHNLKTEVNFFLYLNRQIYYFETNEGLNLTRILSLRSYDGTFPAEKADTGHHHRDGPLQPALQALLGE
jgi:hypothetical protein